MKYEKLETLDKLHEQHGRVLGQMRRALALRDVDPTVFNGGPVEIGLKGDPHGFYLHVVAQDGSAKVLPLATVPRTVWGHLAQPFVEDLFAQGQRGLATRFTFLFPRGG